MGSLRTFALLMTIGTTGPTAFGSPSDDAKPAEAPSSPAPVVAPTLSAVPVDDPGKPAVVNPKADPPAPPRKYLEAGANLYNKGKYELAARYLQAASMYRDRLNKSEQVVLDVYKEKLEEQLRRVSAAPARTPGDYPLITPMQAPPARSGARITAATSATPVPSRSMNPINPVQALSRRPDVSEASVFGPVPDLGPPPGLSASDAMLPVAPGVTGTDGLAAAMTASPSIAPGAVPSPPVDAAATPAALRGSESWRDTTDTKQKGRWLLQLAREQIKKNHFDIAERAIAEAGTLDVQWTLFDETPDRMAEALEKARAKAGLAAGPRAGESSMPQSLSPPRDRRSAKARLKDARSALAVNDLEKAEEIVRQVRTWGVSFGLFDDTPDKVDAAVFEARRREAVHNADLMVRSYYRDRSRPEPERGAMPAGRPRMSAPPSAPGPPPPTEQPN